MSRSSRHVTEKYVLYSLGWTLHEKDCLTKLLEETINPFFEEFEMMALRNPDINTKGPNQKEVADIASSALRSSGVERERAFSAPGRLTILNIPTYQERRKTWHCSIIK
ncbi:hypothetical protein NHQ30_001683 [Ciborinia camelliae]|nr:hypothetical protein NHQ30_001683 [Ciborinia camelliae]